MKNLKSTIIITGGSRGLGLNCALNLAKKGWNLAIVDISDKACSIYKENKNIDEVKSKLSVSNNNVKFYFGDLSNESISKKIIKNIFKDFKYVDGLVNYAGGDIGGNDNNASGGKPNQNNLFIKYKDMNIIYKRNYLSTFFMLRNFINKAKQQSKGKIVNISSISGTFGSYNEFAYANSKNSIIHLTRSAALYSREFNINVNCIAPCGTASARFLKTLKFRGELDKKRFKQKNRLLGFAHPNDISNAVYFFLSDLSDFVSGQVLRIDGGEFAFPA